MLRIALVLAATALAGCQSFQPRSTANATGYVQPTVAGQPPAGFANRDAARAAFTRSCGGMDPTVPSELTATLQDVAWLRYEGSPDEVEAKYRAYFEEGYTSFEVLLVTDKFTKPSVDEVFILEDNTGQRLISKPLTYQSAMSGSAAAYSFAFHFDLSFKHALTADIAWIKLTRQADNTTLTWTFSQQ